MAVVPPQATHLKASTYMFSLPGGRVHILLMKPRWRRRVGLRVLDSVHVHTMHGCMHGVHIVLCWDRWSRGRGAQGHGHVGGDGAAHAAHVHSIDDVGATCVHNKARCSGRCVGGCNDTPPGATLRQ